jgi:hypothetical protein
MIFNRKTAFGLIASAALAPVAFGQTGQIILTAVDLPDPFTTLGQTIFLTDCGPLIAEPAYTFLHPPIPLLEASATVVDFPPEGFSITDFAIAPGLSGLNIEFYPASNGLYDVHFFVTHPQAARLDFTVTFDVGGCDCPAGNGGCDGDPHFKTWRGKRFDFHGECDLVLLHSSAFESGLGLDVHIRTKIRSDMSYISSAALRIGLNVLEVESQGIYYLNGVLSATLPAEFSGFAFSHMQPTDKQHVFEVYLGGRERIKIKTYKDFVSVLIEQGKSEHFLHSVGLMGDFRNGDKIARDVKTVLDDANAFGQEWQVLDTEPSLFHALRLPQHPQKCIMPTPAQVSQLRRRLAETSSADELAAEKVCAHWGEGKDDCIFDVLTTGDLEMAVMGAY